MSFLVIGSSNRRPIRRLTAKSVLSPIGDRLALGRLADQAFAVLGEGDDRRRGARAFRILDDLGLAPIHDGDAAVGGAEVDTDNFGHDFPNSSSSWTPRCRSPVHGKTTRRLDKQLCYGGDIGAVFLGTRDVDGLENRRSNRGGIDNEIRHFRRRSRWRSARSGWPPAAGGDSPAAERRCPTMSDGGMSVTDGRLVLPAVKGNPGAVYFTVHNDGDRDGVDPRGRGRGRQERHDAPDDHGERQERQWSEVDADRRCPRARRSSSSRAAMHVMAIDLDDTLQAGGDDRSDADLRRRRQGHLPGRRSSPPATHADVSRRRPARSAASGR